VSDHAETVPIPDSVRKFLGRPNLAVLATIAPSGRPQATPVWFLLEEDHILINTSAGRVKLRNMETDPRVTLTIVDRDNPYEYVQIRGRVGQFDRDHAARDIDRLSMKYRGKPYTYPPTDAPERRVSVHIRPLRFSGLR